MNRRKLTAMAGLLLLTLGAGGQSFHYFRYKVADADNSTFEALLTLFANGTSTARVRSFSSSAQQETLFELELKDSMVSPEQGKMVNQLFSVNSAAIRSLQAQSVTPDMLFEFSEQVENGMIFYSPSAIKTRQNQTWKKALLLENATYSITQIDTGLVKKFYQESDSFFANLFSNIRQPGLISRGLSSIQKKTKIYMIIVTDTLDEKAGKPCKRDMENMTFVFSSIAQKTGLQAPIITYVRGKSFSRTGVLNALSKTNPGPDDILIFYYSGHGFREAGDSSALPSMVLSNNYTLATLRENSLALQTVTDIIAAKKSRLNFVFNDCCNVETPLPASTGKNPMISPKSIGLPVSTENFVKLFFEPRGTIVGSSSQPAEYSVGNPEKGGFFTWYLLLALQTQLSRYNSNISWEDIFAEAGKNANYLALSGLCGETPNQTRCVQNPWYDFSLLKN